MPASSRTTTRDSNQANGYAPVLKKGRATGISAMSVIFEVLAVLSFVALLRRPTLGRGLILALFIFLRRQGKSGLFLLLFVIFLTGHILAHLLFLARQSVSWMF